MPGVLAHEWRLALDQLRLHLKRTRAVVAHDRDRPGLLQLIVEGLVFGVALRIAELFRPGGAGPVKDQHDLVAVLLQLFGVQEGVQRPGQPLGVFLAGLQNDGVLARLGRERKARLRAAASQQGEVLGDR